jgi:CHAT domain-containing protein
LTRKSVARDVSDLQTTFSSLDQDVVLLQYYLSEDELGAIITAPNYQLSRNRAIDSQELHQKIATFNKLLRNPKLDPRPAAQELYKLIFEPIVGDLEKAGAKTVMLYLDGVLRYIPFAALHDGKQYLVEKYRLPIYTAAARDKLKEKITQNWQVAAMGLSESIGNFPALPGVRAEVEGIVLHGKQGVLPGKVYLNKDFTSQSLKEVTKQDFQVMHIASHFVFSPGTEINSFLLMGDGQELTLGDIRTQNFDFSHVELLTLSACETGMGGGKGVNSTLLN